MKRSRQQPRAPRDTASSRQRGDRDARRQGDDAERHVARPGACRHDPAWLLEGYFHGADFPDDEPETIVLAWFCTLPAGMDPAVAAEFMLTRLDGRTAYPSSKQSRLLDLLEITAGLRSERDADREPGND